MSRFYRSTSGNAFIYILIAVLLFGALSFAISKSNDANPSGEISEASAKAAAASILAYESQARTAIDQMIQNGTNVANIDFTLPSGASFNTAPAINKLFHPDGGGLQYKALPQSAVRATSSKYYIGRFNNFGWTPTTATDIIFTAYNLPLAVCQQLQFKVSGTTIIPSFSTGSMIIYFVDAAISGSANTDFTSTICPTCNGLPMSCGRNGAITSSSTSYTFYSILFGR